MILSYWLFVDVSKYLKFSSRKNSDRESQTTFQTCCNNEVFLISNLDKRLILKLTIKHLVSFEVFYFFPAQYSFFGLCSYEKNIITTRGLKMCLNFFFLNFSVKKTLNALNIKKELLSMNKYQQIIICIMQYFPEEFSHNTSFLENYVKINNKSSMAVPLKVRGYKIDIL